MTSRVDALRSTLDQLALDPRAQEDRPYLISMLRRLGYTDAEIQSALREREPTPPPAPAPASTRPPRPTGPRVIEVEYTGPDYTKDYQPVGPDGKPLPGGATQYVVGEGGEMVPVGEDGEMSFSLADESAGYAGDGEDFGDFDTSAVDNVEANWDDDWGEGGDFGSALAKREKEMENMSETERRKLLQEMGLDPDDPSIVDFSRRKRPEYLNKPKESSVELMEFQELNVTEAPSARYEPQDPALAAGWLPVGDDEPAARTGPELGGWEPDLEERRPGPEWTPTEEIPMEAAAEEVPPWGEAAEQWEPAPGAEGEESWPESEEGAAGAGEGYRHKDYTLYTRDVELSTGKTQRIYFFSKNPPKTGRPSALPAGYEVRENEQTGLPYLRRSEEEGSWGGDDEGAAGMGGDPDAPGAGGANAPRRRVRAVRVRAPNRTEAEEKLRREGREVRGSVPIEFEGDDA